MFGSILNKGQVNCSYRVLIDIKHGVRSSRVRLKVVFGDIDRNIAKKLVKTRNFQVQVRFGRYVCESRKVGGHFVFDRE